MHFEFATATKILFGPGTARQVGAIARDFGRRALIVTGRTTRRVLPLDHLLGEQGLKHWATVISGEPEIRHVEEGARLARGEQVDFVVAAGGGSALDAGKAIAALATNEGEVLDYLEVVGRARSLTRPALPLLVIPTTAGTGAEVTRNAVLASPKHRVKVSLRSPLLLPRLAIVDPELTLELPVALTASTGLDALTQLIEPFISWRANPLTDALCRDGIPRVARALPRVCEGPSDLSSREEMMLGSLLSGLALANAGLGVVHGFAAPIGGAFPAPHGAVCAALLPHAMAINVRALRQREPHGRALQRYAEAARLLTGRPSAGAEDGTAWVSELCATLKIPALRTYGIGQAEVPMLCEKAAAASSMKGNPVALTAEELRELLLRAL